MNGANSSWPYGYMDGKFRHGNHWDDRQVNSKNDSTITKMQHQYWVTKQTVFRKLGKKEDECIIASDAELDAKLELFRSIQESCLDLQRIIEKYQERLCLLAQEENSMGRFLKESAKHDSTGAGNMMLAVGKTMSHSGQQRIGLRTPLLRLFQEVETFRQRAIEDTLRTVQSMEKSRTEYRASLNWMKDVSQELDPDTYKQLERFRKVQERVKEAKSKFDKLKLDCLQKIDLLAAARCNMFSHALIAYHNTLLQFAYTTSKAFSSASESFKQHQHFEFNVVKELAELKPSESPTKEQDLDEKLLDFEDLEEVKGIEKGDGGSLMIEEKKILERSGDDKERNGSVVDLLGIEEESSMIGDETFSRFLPSQLLLQTIESPQAVDTKQQAIPELSSCSSFGSQKSTWLELFSELDPLANPDSVGQDKGEPQRNC